MEGFDQTQGLDALNSNDVTESEDDDNGNDKRVVGSLKVLSQRGFPETDYPVYMGENVIGRSIDECQIHIPIKVLSKCHAVIDVEKDVHMVYDYESHNKSYKGNLPLKPMVRYEIKDGEKLKFGDVKCEYYKTCLVSVGDEDSHSDTATESILTGPTSSKSKLVGTGAKVLAESIEKDVNLLVVPNVPFELKSDSELSDNDDCLIPSSQPEKILVPETPATPAKTTDKKRLSLNNSAKKPIIVSDSDTDIELDESVTAKNPCSGDESVKDHSDRDSDTDIDDLGPTQAYPTDSEYYKMKENQSKPSTSENNVDEKSESEIDWSNLQTQTYISCAIDIPDEEIMNMETQAFPVQEAEVKEYTASEEGIAFAETIPVSEVEIESEPTPKITNTNIESEPFTSQCSDTEFHAVQNKVVEVLQSSALAISPNSPLAKRQSRLAAGTSKSSPVATDDEDISESSSKTTKGSRSKLRLSMDEDAITTQDKNEAEVIKPTSKTRGRKKSVKESLAVVSSEDAEAEIATKGRKGGRRKRKSDEKLDGDVSVDSSSKKVRASTSKDKGAALLPEPVVLNPALSCSPRTYSRKERPKENADLVSQVTYATEEKPSLNETVVQLDDESCVNDETIVDSSPEQVTTSSKTKRLKLTSDEVLETTTADEILHNSPKDSSNDSSPPVESASTSSRGKRKKPVPLICEDSYVESAEVLSSPERILKVKPPVKIPSTSNTPFRRVGRRLDVELAEDKDEEDVFEDTRQTPSKRRAKQSKESDENTENTEIQSPVRLTRGRKKTNASVKSPHANVDDADKQNKVQKRGRSCARKVSPAVASFEEETPKPHRGRPTRKSSSREKSPLPVVDDQPVTSPRASRKRNQKKDESNEDVASKGKGAKRSKKQKVVTVSLETDSSHDEPKEDADEGTTTVEEEAEIPSSRSRSRARNGTTKMKQSSNVTSTPVTSVPVSNKRRGRPPGSSPSADRSPKSPRVQLNKPKIMFTGFSDPSVEKTVKKLGGLLTDSVFEATHLVTDKIRRTCKLLCMVARGQPVVGVEWLQNCEEAKSFVDSSPFLVKDKASEDQFVFSLSKSLTKASNKLLLNGFSIHVTKSVKPDPEQMQPIIECAGGQFLLKMPRKAPDDNTTRNLVISCHEDMKLCSPAIKADIPVVGAEFILTGILRQEVDIKSNLLCDGEPSSPENKKKGTPKRNKVSETKASPAKSINSPKTNGVRRKQIQKEDSDFTEDDDVVESKKVKKGTKSKAKGGKEVGSRKTPSRATRETKRK